MNKLICRILVTFAVLIKPSINRSHRLKRFVFSFSKFIIIFLFFKQLEIIAQKYDFKLTDAIETIPEEAMKMILNGGDSGSNK